MAFRSQDIPKRSKIIDSMGVDDRQIAICADLNQAQIGPKSVFGDKFGIKTDDFGRGEALTIVLKLRLSCDVLVLHAAFLRSSFEGDYDLVLVILPEVAEQDHAGGA